MSELTLDVGQANELKMAFRREGQWTNEEIKILCERKGFLSSVHEALLGRAEIKPVEYLVDFDAKPFIPNGWTILPDSEQLAKRVCGQWKFDPTKVELYLNEGQKNGKSIEGNDLRKKLANQPVMNANLLDFYLAHPKLIPESWKGQYVFFWGTIYRSADGNLCVRYLYWNGGRWYWDCYWLENDWDSNYPSAVSGK